MKIRMQRFNIYLMLALAVVLACGCQTAEGKRKKQLSTLRLHLESNPDSANRTEAVAIGHEHLVTLNVESQPFLTEANIKSAKVLDVMGGFVISLQFDRQGMWMFEEYTVANIGKHFGIFSQWVTPPEKTINKGRWLAAPKIIRRSTDGLLIFTPDTTREEADQIVLGINNVARKIDQDETNRW
jgi:preprotein translocase subunit SecD